MYVYVWASVEQEFPNLNRIWNNWGVHMVYNISLHEAIDNVRIFYPMQFT